MWKVVDGKGICMRRICCSKMLYWLELRFGWVCCGKFVVVRGVGEKLGFWVNCVSIRL